MTKSLFIVEVTYKAYVWAEDFEAAEDFADEIVRTEDYSEVNSHPVSRDELGWSGRALVYHDGDGDLLLKDLLSEPIPIDRAALP